MTNSEYSGSGNNATVWGKLDPEDDYLISSDGQVKSTKFGKERLLKLGTTSNGYLCFVYCKDGKKTTLKVHRCVAEVFLGDRSAEGLYVLHKDGNKLNNKKENLYWGTQQQNMNDRTRHGTVFRPQGEKQGNSKLKEADIYKIRELRLTGMTHQKIADFFGVNQSLISYILSGKLWAHL